MRFTAALAAYCLLLAPMSMPAQAHAYPDRPIKLIVPFPAGGGADVSARNLTRYMSEDLGQQIVIINQPGAGGALAFAEGSRAAPDGYTLLWTSVALAVVAATMPNVPFNLATDFTHIAAIAENPFVLVVNPNVAAKNVGELVALARAKPKTLNFAHNGSGTLTKLALSLFALQTGTDINDVSYRGNNFSSSDVVAGHVQGMFSNSPVALPHVAEGRLRALGVTSPKRSPAAPDLPTLQEAGVPDFQAVVWHGLSAPAGLPKPIAERLNAAVNKALKHPGMVAHMTQSGIEPVGGTAADFQRLVEKEVAYWTSVAKRAEAAGK